MNEYEVFRKEKSDKSALEHVGSVVAPDMDLAVQYAREVFSRRNEAQLLWVVPRNEVAVVSDEDFLQPPLDRSYRMGVAYRVTVDKRKALKAEVKGAA